VLIGEGLIIPYDMGQTLKTEGLTWEFHAVGGNWFVGANTAGWGIVAGGRCCCCGLRAGWEKVLLQASCEVQMKGERGGCNREWFSFCECNVKWA
jgi:hypothetical protein